MTTRRIAHLGLSLALLVPTLAAADPVLVPFVVEAVRHPGPVAARLLVYNPAPDGAAITLTGLRVDAAGRPLLQRDLARRLPGDPRYGEVAALVERLPTEITERHGRRWFASGNAPELAGREVTEARRRLAVEVAQLRAHYAELPGPPFAELSFELDLRRLFPAAARPGDSADLILAVDWRDAAGAPRTSRVATAVRLLPALPGAPRSLAADLGAPVTIHAGDLHVHSCHGEALNACAPSENCAAESLQLLGSFTFAELKSQYRALGLDWFTATDHSYCINSDAEFDAIAGEIAAINDATFVAYPDTELSSDEEGAQQGSDLGDLLCLGLTEANHMGAHGITSRKFGGDDGLLGFCDGIFSDALRGFRSNVEAIRAEGGYPVINHPALDSWGWNSFEAVEGIEAGMLHGVEIWSGATQAGQGSHVGQWVDWLLGGRILYAYSGSDTHDEAFPFGATQVVLTAPFAPDTLRAAIEAGRAYVSDAHLLALTARAGGATLVMGDLRRLPADPPPGAELELRAHYAFGGDTAVITIFRGRVGDTSEEVVCTSAALTGGGVFTCADPLVTDGRSYYRAYAEDVDGAHTAYTNPIFLLP